MSKIKIDTIIFDFDSTLLRGELLEILAETKLKNHPDQKLILDKIKEITNQGMSGEISFHESLSSRLSLLELNETTLTESMPHIINLLNEEYFSIIPKLKSKNVYIISGGYSNILHPLSVRLSLPKDNIFAIKLNFKQGIFSHLNENDPLIESDGKARVAKSIRDKGRTLMVGDGMTDYQVKAHGGADYFAAYTGVAERQEVKDKADFVLDDLRLLEGLAI